MIEILKASAGSGKTYALSHRYIRMLLESGSHDAYRHILAVTFTNKATSEMKARILRDLSSMAETDERARRMVTEILHDYGAFAVSTIDKFFQQTLKAFSRETGQVADYRIELDRDSLIRETVDRMLDSLTADSRDVLEWLSDAMREKFEAGESCPVENILVEMGGKLKSQEYMNLAASCGADGTGMFSKERIVRIRKRCGEIIGDFNRKLGEMGEKPGPGGRYKEPGKRYLKEHPALAELLSGREWKVYNTVHAIRSSLFSLGLAGEFLVGFDALLKEKNLMCLDESTAILKDIIDGSDAPFVYEKVGVRYEHFLLDEFQDTSNLQWDNFKPLLKESEARGMDCLIVGDVKQSIYRFRDSDWRLLAEKVQREFRDVEVRSLDNNWRSAPAIVEFNNSFFPFAASKVGLSDLYADVRQNVMSGEKQSGQVRVSFRDPSDEPAAVLSSIRDALAAGARYGDIAVLVRGHSQGVAVASALIAAEVPVISDDSLEVKSSVVVKRLVALLSCIENPEDGISAYVCRSLGVEVPAAFHSLADLCEQLLRGLRENDPQSFEGQTQFIQAFLDDVQGWTETNGNSLRHYLRHWEDTTLNISSPDGADAVRIITIHKAKGLEFPYLIFPFAEEVGLFRHGDHWCRLDAAAHGLDPVLDGLYPVTLSSKCSSNLFEDDYLRERRMQIVDNLNIFYVALTRAEKTLHVISARPSQAFVKSMGKSPEYKRFSDILYEYCGGDGEFVSGEPYDFTLMERKAASSASTLPGEFVSVPLAGRLAPSGDACDFFSDEGVAGLAASPRLNGIVLHSILSEIDTLDDLHPAIARRVADGLMDEQEGADAEKMLRERISAHPEWFSGGGRNEVTILVPGGLEKRPDRVLRTAGGVVVIDYKFGESRESYRRQVGGYMSLFRAMGCKDVRGFVWYVPSDTVVEVRNLF